MNKTQAIEQAFKRGEILTVQKALKYGTTELRSVVSRLRKRGMNIKDRVNILSTEGYKEYWYDKTKASV